MEMMDKVFKVVDDKMQEIEQQNKRPAVIILNEALFKQIQQEMFLKDSLQHFGVVRSPYSLQVYRGARVVLSQVCETVEVF